MTWPARLKPGRPGTPSASPAGAAEVELLYRRHRSGGLEGRVDAADGRLDPVGHPAGAGVEYDVDAEVTPVTLAPRPPLACRDAAGTELGSRAVALGGELEGDVDDHVLLAADVACLADALQDLVSRDAVALRGALSVQQE